MIYTVYEFLTTDQAQRDWLMAVMGDSDFDGFEETDTSIKGYAPVNKVTDTIVRQLLDENNLNHVQFTSQPVADKNWNEEWEKNFEPVVIAGKVGIRAPFHPPLNINYELVIEPKMSFGTGHHATTASVITLMLGEDLAGKSVLDFGSGTGILSILAEKLKASNITAIDHEEWAYNNCVENIERNGCVKITALRGDDNLVFKQKFDVILANINRNVILANMHKWVKLLSADAILIVSGILVADEADVTNLAINLGLVKKEKIEKNGWLAISFQHL
jgi:ribosomal protein L11 methyltransferase